MSKPIRHIDRKERFEWWGSSFEEARRVALSKPKGLKDKRMPLEDAVKKFVRLKVEGKL